jgi:hypothetical protein
MFFHFLKIIFDISTSKRSKKYKPHSILAKKKKNLKFGEKQVQPQNQTASKRVKWRRYQCGIIFFNEVGIDKENVHARLSLPAYFSKTNVFFF